MEDSDDTKFLQKKGHDSLSAQSFAKENDQSNFATLHASPKSSHLELIDQLPTDSIARLWCRLPLLPWILHNSKVPKKTMHQCTKQMHRNHMSCVTCADWVSTATAPQLCHWSCRCQFLTLWRLVSSESSALQLLASKIKAAMAAVAATAQGSWRWFSLPFLCIIKKLECK